MAHRHNDWRDWRDYAERMGRLYDEAAPRGARYRDEHDNDLEQRADYSPAADVVERETEFLILIDLPGIDRAKLDVEIVEDRLVVRGERAADEGSEAKRRGNRPTGRFLAKFGPLPPTIDQSQVGAEYRDGVLRLRLPKRALEQAGRVKIEIK